MERSCPLSILKSPPRRLSTTPPLDAGRPHQRAAEDFAQVVLQQFPPISVVSTIVVYMSGQMASP